MITKFVRLGVMFASAAVVAILSLTPRPGISQPVPAAGFEVEENCPDIDLPSGIWAQMAFNNNGKKLYLTRYTPAGEVYVRDPHRCSQELLIDGIDSPLGIAVHPDTGNLYVTHRYENPDYDGALDPAYKQYLSAVSIYSSAGEPLIQPWVDGFASAVCCGPGPGGNGLQSIVFDEAGNLYMVTNVDVWQPVSDPPNFYASSSLYKIDPSGVVTEFATGIRASFEAVIADTNRGGVATAFYAGDNGEGDECAAAETCGGRVLALAGGGEWYFTRMYYDELNYVVEGGHYGYPESAPNGPYAAGENVTHIGPLWNFEKRDNGAPVPTGLALKQGRWGNVNNPLFQGFWRSPNGIDMFTGPHRSERSNVVSGVGVMDVVVCPQGDQVFFGEYNFGTPRIYTLQPAGRGRCGGRGR